MIREIKSFISGKEWAKEERIDNSIHIDWYSKKTIAEQLREQGYEHKEAKYLENERNAILHSFYSGMFDAMSLQEMKKEVETRIKLGSTRRKRR